MSAQYLRTKRDGCYSIFKNPYWGSYLKQIDDPEAHVDELGKDAFTFELVDNFPKIPAKLWSKVVRLYFDYASKSGDEVGVEFFRNEADPSQWRCLVPEQIVSPGSVHTKDASKAADIETGEEISSYPPEGWLFAGSSH